MTDGILSPQFHAAAGAETWRVLPEDAFAFFASDSFPRSVRFVEEIRGLFVAGGADLGFGRLANVLRECLPG